jgi:histidinol-phosphate aminotransferase
MDESKGTVKLQLDSLLKGLHSNTKCIYLSSPNTVSGQSITKDEFEDFLTKVPDNVIIYLDQRYYEFSNNKTGVNGRDFIHINPNLFVQRSFNNFYGIKDLSLSYLMCSPKLFNFVSKTMTVNIVDDYQEMLALSCLEDIAYYNRIKKKMVSETERIQKLYKKKNMKTIPTETNYFLVQTTRDVDTIRRMLEKQNIVLYQSLDKYNDYWTLPISEPHINTKVMNLILYGI